MGASGCLHLDARGVHRGRGNLIETHTGTEGCQESRALGLAKQWYARMTADERREFIVWMMGGAPQLLQAASNPDSRPPADVGGRS